MASINFLGDAFPRSLRELQRGRRLPRLDSQRAEDLGQVELGSGDVGRRRRLEEVFGRESLECIRR
jgi:hypothetical protein